MNRSRDRRPAARCFRALAVVVFVGFAVGGPTSAVADEPFDLHAARAYEQTVSLDYDKAHAELAKGDPNDPAVVLAKARLALYEEECDLSAALASRPEVARSDEGRQLADVARGCARVTAATVVEKDEANGVVVRFHDEADRALSPILVETVVKARESLTRDLGVQFKKPIRITVVRDLLSLSAMTGLPYKAAQTTGTVAVAKWGRVTMLSPRASKHGYPWRDTLAHELTHHAISMQTLDRAPLWLHEGVARREEVRWREPGPFDDKPSAESIVLRGMEMKLDLELDKLGPSIAMLPSADQAMVAFAEVTSFIRFYTDSQPPDALAKLLLALRDEKDVDAALKKVSGETLAQWDVRWRAQLAKRKVEPLSPLFGLGATPPGFGDARERSRLAELLVGRNHPNEALAELDKIPEALLVDASLRYIRARALEGDGSKTKAAEELLADPKIWMASFGPCWAVRGRLLRASAEASGSDSSSANAAFFEAVAHDPLGIEAACETLPSRPNAVRGSPLCEAARQRGEPDLGND